MAPRRRNVLHGAGLPLAALLCVAGVLAILCAGAPGRCSPRTIAVIAATHDVRLSADPARRPEASGARGPALAWTAAAPSVEKSAAVRRDGPVRLGGDTPEGRDEHAARRASGSTPRTAGQHERPLGALRTAVIDVARWAPPGAGSRLCAGDLPSRSSARRCDGRPPAIERDIHAPRGPPPTSAA